MAWFRHKNGTEFEAVDKWEKQARKDPDLTPIAAPTPKAPTEEPPSETGEESAKGKAAAKGKG